MVTEADTKPKKINPQNILRDGFKWQRQLVFRSKLTMHTAYDRKDNAEPASITALAVSRYIYNLFIIYRNIKNEKYIKYKINYIKLSYKIITEIIEQCTLETQGEEYFRGVYVNSRDVR